MKFILEEPFKALYDRAYLTTMPNGVQYVKFYNSKQDQSTMTYLRYLKSVQLGRILTFEEKVVAADGDRTNCDLGNLLLLSVKGAGRSKRVDNLVSVVCAGCGRTFERNRQQHLSNERLNKVNYHSFACYNEARKGVPQLERKPIAHRPSVARAPESTWNWSDLNGVLGVVGSVDPLPTASSNVATRWAPIPSSPSVQSSLHQRQV